MLYRLKNSIVKLIIPFTFLSLILLFIFYNILVRLLGATMFFVVFLFLLVLFCTALIYRVGVKSSGKELVKKISERKIIFFFILVSIFYSISLFYDVSILGYRFYSVFVFFISLPSLLVLVRQSTKNVFFITVVAFLLFFIASTYLFYPPSLGNDSWRDVVTASTIFKNGNIYANYHPAYPIPTVPLIYSITSIVSSITIVNASALLGIIYTLFVVLLIFLISIKINPDKKMYFPAFVAIILALSNPLILLWSIAYIPEANAIIMFLLLILILTSNSFTKDIGKISTVLLMLLLACAIVLSHGGINLWVIFFLGSLLTLMKIYKVKTKSYDVLKNILPIIGAITLGYFLYTTLFDMINGGVENLTVVLFRFLSLSTPVSKVSPATLSSPEATALLSYGPIVICVVIALFVGLGNNPKRTDYLSVLKETIFLFGIAGVVMGFLGTVYLPEAILDRYLLLGSLLLLVVISSKGFDELLKRGVLGKFLLMVIIILSAMSVAFGATITPDLNLFNVSNSFSVQAPPSWSDTICINTVVMYTNSARILVDWRTGLPLLYSFANQHSTQNFEIYGAGAEIHFSEGETVQIPFIGYSVHRSVNKTYVEQFMDADGILIYRAIALDDMSLINDGDAIQLRDDLIKNYNIVYVGTMEVFTK